ncbi:protein translocase subunit SecD [Paraburkholderia caribensis]|jgi:preprotein translocase subunit SecD|uniref:protein translocase subunit SecD n=1 Tax=Paraburkholderia caribensis TaxID=75105 RepID=UPI00071EB9A4|nr:protein translocase subunit SecD [Paraburkholderia caribensis]ALP62043.1 preprotein translocase subunit SecD [Paraburkholderia caribensis]AMV43643.1 preprotein translocase subunit SecD [Paraburkholderia caribensis]AUT52727.1 protein translocase subunit SecD [Paraburkholderia caribensis]MDR6384936.1 preprotein translocase subunit SecD [Paraburkholderia caribensis]CAG9235209.1 Sec translocon accessory complex subunit SecD [Paraburkholderia caribensis]
MNRYPLWKYVVMLVALVIGLVYTLPNFFGEAPAVQVSSGKATVKLDSTTLSQVEGALASSQIKPDDVTFDNSATNANIRVRLKDTDTQLRVKDLLQKALNSDPSDPQYIVALNLQSASPRWLTALHALPMYLGLDLRGGVHFLLQVDMAGALNKKLDSDASDARTLLRDKGIRDGGVNRVGQSVVINFADQDVAENARKQLVTGVSELQWATQPNPAGGFQAVGTFTPAVQKTVEDAALKQNITTLHNRVNELGVAEPVIQQQGSDRIVVELPGVQDTAKAKDIIGRTATLEARLADPNGLHPNPNDPVPAGDELFTQGNAAPVLLRKAVIFTGDRIIDASAGFDEHQRPSVNIRLDSAGGRAVRSVSRDNIGKPMAMVLFEKGKGEVLTVATIQSELGDRFQITGQPTPQAATDLALLLRAGSLAAPMDIIEERTIGPSLGADNIKKGFHSVVWGFAAIAVFMIAYYMLFGLISMIALSVNLLLLIAILSMLQATLTLPGIAAIALALGMAIDANVLINERVREELRNGAPPQLAIQSGYAHAWATILDSNVTTLIAGLALLAFGSGPVRGFAVVHCIGIMTSMFSAVFFSRGLVNLWYGGKKKLQTLAIGQVWKPAAAEGATAYLDNADTQTDTARAIAAATAPKAKPKAKAPAGAAKAQAAKPTLRNRNAPGGTNKPGSSR